MIRPSLLQIAELCGLAPKLAAEYPEASAAAERGTEIHRQIASGRPETPEARTALAFLAAYDTGQVQLEQRLRLTDPETGELITEGTADVVIRRGGSLEVFDWKTGRPENVEPASNNLQLWAYALAAMDDATESLSASLVFLSGEEIWRFTSNARTAAETWPMLDRIRAAASRPPVASPGVHCGGCYQRKVCPSYRERTSLALTLLPASTDLALTDETAAQLVQRVQQVREACELAEAMARAHVRNGGRIEADGKAWGPTMTAGRRSGPSVKELEAQGLGHMVRTGAPTERWAWSKVRP